MLEKRRKANREYKRRNYDKITQQSRNRFESLRQKENERRKSLGLPLINEDYKSEIEMKFILNNLLPNELILDNKYWGFDKNNNFIRIGGAKGGLQLDRYYPNLRLAFEYNGLQHFDYREFFHKDYKIFLIVQNNDQKKQEMCQKAGINLIIIKYNEKLSEQLILDKLKESGFEMEVLCQKQLA